MNVQFSQPITASALAASRQGLASLFKRSDLGFWQLPSRDENWQVSEEFARNIQKKYSRLVVVGMGGSAMGGRTLVRSLRPEAPVEFLLNTDPAEVKKFLDREDLFKGAHFLFISKSGGTLELACLLALISEKILGSGRSLSEAISVVTEDKTSALHTWAVKQGCALAPHPLDVGGRFSVFSPVGLIPAQVAGLSLQALRQGARRAVEASENAVHLAAFYWQRFQAHEVSSAFWLYLQSLGTWSDWLEQLWAESLAKKTNRKGAPAPLVSVPVFYQGTCDQHSVLQQVMESGLSHSVCFVRSSEKISGLEIANSDLTGFEYLKNISLNEVFWAQSQSTELALQEAGVPTCSLHMDGVNESSLAELMMTFQLVIGILGEALDINAFDQPGVELGKKITKEKLARRPGH